MSTLQLEGMKSEMEQQAAALQSDKESAIQEVKLPLHLQSPTLTFCCIVGFCYTFLMYSKTHAAGKQGSIHLALA